MVRPFSWLGVFVQKSKSLNPNSAARDGFANSLPPERGNGTELGFKFEFFGGRLVGAAGIFDISEFNRALNDPNAPRQTSFYLDANGNPQLISGPNDPRYNPNLPGQSRGALVAAGEAKSQGFDTDFIFSVNRSLQLLGSYAYLDGYVKRDVNNTLGTLVGRPLPNSNYHRAALLSKYKFVEGPLKGLDVVLGLNWRSRVYVDTINTTTTATNVIAGPVFRYAKPAWGGDFRLGYSARLFDRKWDFGFNIGNLLETEMRAGFVPRLPYADTPYYYNTPRTYTFSTGVSF
jgi:iron complex outermembrane recepter protein